MTELFSALRNILILAGYINQNVAFPEPLSREEEQRLIHSMCKTGDENARAMLIEHNLRLASHIAKKYAGTGEDIDELISIGSFGLIKAVSTFSPEKGALSAYASRCIENEILMHLRSERRRKESETSLENPVGRDADGNEVTVGERLASDDEDIQETAFRGIFREKIDDALSYALSDREREVIELRYNLSGKGALPQREIGKRLKVSRSYVSRIEKKALAKLNKYLTDCGDMPFRSR